MDCPQCSNLARMLKSQMRKSGKRWRRWRCQSCSHAWSTLHDPQVSFRNEANRRRRKLTDSQAREIAASNLSLKTLSERYGVTSSKVWKLKHRLLYRDVLAAPGEANTCDTCAYWRKGCAFDFPEAGGSFAEECSMFEATGSD